MTSPRGGSPQNPLSSDELEELARKAAALAADYLSSVSQRPLVPTASLEDLKQAFSDPIPQSGSPLNALLEQVKGQIIANSAPVGSRRFFGLMDSPPLPIAVFADMLASALNQNLANWSTSPAATLVELQVVRWFAELAALPNAAGLLVSSGSVANLLALRLARNRKLTDASSTGLACGPNTHQPKIYCSRHAHSSLEKAVEVLGLGRSSLVRIETDDRLRMRPDALETAIAGDLNEGNLPLGAVATAGTTYTGAIDPLAEIAAVSREHGLWFHVDASYGGAALFSERAARSFKGISIADSLVIDPHKWLYVPFQAAFLLARRETFLEHPLGKGYGYIYDAPEGVPNLSDFALQGSKRFDALKVWLSLKMLGVEGYQSLIQNDLDNAQHFHRLLADSEEFQPLSPPELGIVAFRFVPLQVSGENPSSPDNKRIIDEATTKLHKLLSERARVWIGTVTVGRRPLLQACFSNYAMTGDDVDFLYSELRNAARETS